MRLVGTACLALALCVSPASGQTSAPFESAERALVDGAVALCPAVYKAFIEIQRGVASAEGAEAALLQGSAWTPIDDPPALVLSMNIDHEFAQYAEAALPPGIGRVFVGLTLRPFPQCEMVWLDAAPNSNANVLAALDAHSELVRLETPMVSPGSGINMFGLYFAEHPRADLGVAVYDPASQAVESRGIGAVVSVGFVPKAVLETGVYDPRRY